MSVVVILLVTVAAALLATGVRARSQAVVVGAAVLLVVAYGLGAWAGWLTNRLWAFVVAVAVVAAIEVTRVEADLRRRGGPVVVEAEVRRGAFRALALPAVVGVVAWLVVGWSGAWGPNATAGRGWLPAALGGVAAVVVVAAWAVALVGRRGGAAASGRHGLAARGRGGHASGTRRGSVAQMGDAGPGPGWGIGRGLARRPVAALAVAALVVIATAGLVSIGSRSRIDFRDDGTASAPASNTGVANGAPSSTPDVAPEAAGEPTGTDRRLPVDAPLGLFVLLAAVFVLLAISGRDQIVPPEDLVPDASVGSGLAPEGVGAAPVVTLAEQVATTMEEAAVFLRADLEPRLAVRCAYATVAAGLGQTALARRVDEAEGEYLARALRTVGGGGAALRRLTELFAVARFSAEPVDAAMRAAALSALDEVRAAVLAEASSPPSGTPVGSDDGSGAGSGRAAGAVAP